MGTLENHDTKTQTTVGSEVVTNASSGSGNGASGHHADPQAGRGGNNPKAGMGSDRLPQGKLDSPRVP